MAQGLLHALARSLTIPPVFGTVPDAATLEKTVILHVSIQFPHHRNQLRVRLLVELPKTSFENTGHSRVWPKQLPGHVRCRAGNIVPGRTPSGDEAIGLIWRRPGQ